MKKLTFLIAYEQSPHAGSLRPFLNWIKGLNDEHELIMIFFKCGDRLRNSLEITSKTKIFETSKIENIVKYLKKENIDWIIGDDYHPRLKLITQIKKTLNCRSAVYAQILFGFNSITRVSSHSHLPLKSKILLKGASLVPFKLLTSEYVNNLNKHDLIIPNSRNVRLILQILYGIKTESHIYPPLDIDFFRNNLKKSPNDVLIYLGSNAGDTNGKFLENIIELLIQKKINVNVFGNLELIELLATKFSGVTTYSDISNAEIVKLYSRNILTICPQKFEMFGYVPVESMSCGTPVLAFDMMGPGETIIDGKTGWLAKDESDFLKVLNWILDKKAYSFVECEKIRKYAIEICSIENSSKNLINILNSKERMGH